MYCYIADLSRVSSGNEQFYLYDWNYSGRTLHVLQGMADAYRADENWYPYFGQIVDDLIETPRGDVNGDGEVNIADINAVIAIILGGNGDTATADVNGDGEVNIADINAVIAIILGGEDEPEHTWVDLGLPSCTLWATCNVGANSPEEYGDYFAWGETEPKEVYDWSTYKWCNGTDDSLTKYCTDSSFGYNGFVDNKIELDPADDAACAHYPGGRMPSVEQIQELIGNCNWQWTQRNGVNGHLITGPNGNTMFLPAAGYHNHESLHYMGSYGFFWSRTLLYSYNPRYACDLYFNSGDWSGWDFYRNLGLTVRAVRMSQD